MILPKGTIESQKNGGDEAIKVIMNDIAGKKVTGYLLILGALTDDDGSERKITGQMVFKEGEPTLCETTLEGKANKGKKGVFPLLKAMTSTSNKIELHTKIDVAPPMAFFKECRIAEKDVNLDLFMKAMQDEAQEKIRREEEKKLKLEKKAQITTDVNGWIEQGYVLKDVKKKLEMDFEKLDEWFNTISANITRIEEIKAWIEPLNDRELKSLKKEIEKSLTSPEKIEEIEKHASELKEAYEGISDKRGEMEKWSKLWKEEGYNTARIEEALSGDVDSAWNVLTEFMDEIQQLKDMEEEIDQIKALEGASAFQTEMDEITAISKDPNQIILLKEKVDTFRTTIKKEKAQKEELFTQALEWKEKGFSIDALLSLKGERLERVVSEFNAFKENSQRVLDMRQELENIDRRDIPDRIDELKGELNDPSALPDYEARFAELKAAIEDFGKRREELNVQIEELRARGIITTSIDDKLDMPIPELQSALESLNGKVEELGLLATEIDQMDQRWMEDEFSKLDPLLKDPDRIDELKEDISRLRKAISDREERRGFIKAEMETWREEGFPVAELEKALKEDLNTFTEAYNALKSSIDECKVAIEKLDSLELRFFQVQGEELKARMKDPGQLPKALGELEGLEAKVTQDSETRSKFMERLDGLAKDGWGIDTGREVLHRVPADLEGGISAFEENIKGIQEAMADAAGWDALETGGIKEELDELNAVIKDVDLIEESLAKHGELKQTIETNSQRRKEMMDLLSEWEEKGYMVDEVKKFSQEKIETFSSSFEALKEKINRLESFQQTFDSLDTKHFQQEAEDLEEKLNDPNLLDEIEKEIGSLIKKVGEDRKKRDGYIEKIDKLVEEGFMGAQKLAEIMEEDLSIVGLEFKNFEKEVDMLRKYMVSTGYQPPGGSAPAGKKNAKKGEKVEAPSSMKLIERFTFENFVVGSSNRFAKKAAEAVADHPADAYNPLFIYGGSGLGKSHLINSIGNKVHSGKKKLHVVYTTTEKFINDLINAVSDEGLEAFREQHRRADVLLIDDIEFISGQEATQEEFFNTFNHLANNGKQIVITSDRPPKEIPKLTDRLKSRFEGGLIVDVAHPTIETKMVILKKEAKSVDLILPEEVIQLLADRIVTNVRVLEGAVKRIAARVKMDGREPDIELAEEILSDVLVDDDEGDIEQAMEALKEKISSLQDDDEEETQDPGKEKPAEEEPPTEPADDAMVKCTACNKDIPASATECPECGVSFEGEVYECPLCHAEVPPGSTECPGCGAKFET
ncbi:MAG: ATP-binding protein [Thermoplasmata archaeon]|nr:ATP-binding protein [Thermoplasmata archaeon]